MALNFLESFKNLNSKLSHGKSLTTKMFELMNPCNDKACFKYGLKFRLKAKAN